MKQMLNEEHIDLLENGLGLALKDEAEIDADDMWQHKSIEELKTLGNEQLKTICKKYGRPYSNKRKDQLIETIRQGPKEDLSITEAEKIIKYSFLQPLSQEDRSAHKLGNLNEDKVRTVLGSVMSKLGWKLVDSFECGLIRNKMNEFLATSLDGWLIIQYVEKDWNDQNYSDSEKDDDSIERREYNCGLEIKTPSSKKVIQGCIMEAVDLHGTFSCCEFGSSEFKQLVYKPEYRTQVLHHATVANLPYILFVVAGETKVRYATLI